jgi:5'-nucleotidase
MLRDDAFNVNGHTAWYQFSKGFYCEYDRPTQTIVSLKINGKEVQDSDLYKVAIQGYHYTNIEEYLDLKPEEIERNGKPLQAASSSQNVLEEYFASHPLIELDGSPRLIIHE